MSLQSVELPQPVHEVTLIFHIFKTFETNDPCIIDMHTLKLQLSFLLAQRSRTLRRCVCQWQREWKGREGCVEQRPIVPLSRLFRNPSW